MALLQQAASAAVRTLAALMEDEHVSPSVRVSAARSLLEINFRGLELENLDLVREMKDKLRELEDRLVERLQGAGEALARQLEYERRSARRSRDGAGRQHLVARHRRTPGIPAPAGQRVPTRSWRQRTPKDHRRPSIFKGRRMTGRPVHD